MSNCFLIRDGGDGEVLGLLIDHRPSKTNLKNLGWVADPVKLVSDNQTEENDTLSLNDSATEAAVGMAPVGFMPQMDTEIWRGSDKWEEYMAEMDE